MHLERSELYGQYRIVELVETEESRYGHLYGGPVQHHGATEREYGYRLHLLYLINTADPRVPINIPGLPRLPLYYGFSQHSTMRLGYRVLSETRIETYPPDPRHAVDDSEPIDYPEYPYEDFPDEFPERAIHVRKSRFDPLNPEHVLEYINVFGVDSLSRPDRRALIDGLRKDHRPPFYESPAGTDEELVLECASPTCQGHPESVCPNPECPNHTIERGMQIVAIVPAYPFGGCWEHETLDVYSPWCELSDLGCTCVEIIFESCPRCHAFMVTNQILT